jgi:hypothetical protein
MRNVTTPNIINDRKSPLTAGSSYFKNFEGFPPAFKWTTKKKSTAHVLYSAAQQENFESVKKIVYLRC